jgi:hypothetical protein
MLVGCALACVIENRRNCMQCLCDCGHVAFTKTRGRLSEVIFIMEAGDWEYSVRDV